MATEDHSSKLCSACKQWKPRSEFHKRVASVDGLCPKCKPCAIAHVKSYADKNKKRLYDAEYRVKNIEKVKARSLKYASEHKEEAKRRAKEWALANPERVKSVHQRLYQANKSLHRENNKQWKKSNPHKVLADTAMRRAKQHSAIPAWADKKAIRSIYQQARAARLHVDHIVPLRSKLVCGLHCESNLQLLPPHENHVKSNRVWPDMP